MTKTFIRTSLALAAAAAAVLPVQAQQGVTDTEIVVGDILPLSGPPALLGVAHNLGVKLAVAEANAAGGINGRRVRLISEDDGYVVSRTLQGVRKLVTSDKVFALTSLSGTAQGQAALPLIAELGVPTISTISVYKELYDPVKKNVFAIGGDHAVGAKALTTFMAERFPNKKWAIISQNDEYGEKIREGFEAAVKDKKLNVVSSQIYKKGQVDFSSEALKVKQSGAEVVVAAALITETVAIAKELERLGHKIPIGTTYVSRVPALLALMGSAGENVYSVDFVSVEDSPAGVALMDLAKKHLSEDEQKRLNRYTFTGYAGAKVMFEGFRRCGKALTWECTIKQLETLKDYSPGVTSPITFTATDRFAGPAFNFMKADVNAKKFVPAN